MFVLGELVKYKDTQGPMTRLAWDLGRGRWSVRKLPEEVRSTPYLLPIVHESELEKYS